MMRIPSPRMVLADREQVLLNHAEQDETVLAVVLPAILANHGKRIVERKAGSLEAHAMTGVIPGGFSSSHSNSSSCI